MTGGATSFNLHITLQVFVEGMTPYEVSDQWMVKAKDCIGLSGSIPIKVDPDEPEKVAIDWETLRAEVAQHEEQRRASLAAMGPVGAGGIPAQVTQAPPPALDFRNDPELRAKLEALLGRELVPGSTIQVAQGDPMLQMQILQTIQQHRTEKAMAAAAPATAAAASGGDDMISQLERLSALRASGALTEAEFEAQKARILGG